MFHDKSAGQDVTATQQIKCVRTDVSFSVLAKGRGRENLIPRPWRQFLHNSTCNLGRIYTKLCVDSGESATRKRNIIPVSHSLC